MPLISRENIILLFQEVSRLCLFVFSENAIIGDILSRFMPCGNHLYNLRMPVLPYWALILKSKSHQKQTTCSNKASVYPSKKSRSQTLHHIPIKFLPIHRRLPTHSKSHHFPQNKTRNQISHFCLNHCHSQENKNLSKILKYDSKLQISSLPTI